jgi:hypothetical protein
VRYQHIKSRACASVQKKRMDTRFQIPIQSWSLIAMPSKQINPAPSSANEDAPLQVAWDDLHALGFAIDFAQGDHADKVNARQMREFAFGPPPEDYDFADLRKATYELLSDLTRGGFAGYSLRFHGVLRPTSKGAGSRFRAVPNRDAMSFQDRFMYRLVRLLEPYGHRLRRCPAPKPREEAKCDRIFLKVTRKDHCSESCRQRAYMRGVRSDEKEQRRARRNAKTTRKR